MKRGILLDDDVHVEGGEEAEKAHNADKGIETQQPAPVTRIRSEDIGDCEDVITIVLVLKSGLDRREECVLVQFLQELVTNNSKVLCNVIDFDAEINTKVIPDIR